MSLTENQYKETQEALAIVEGIVRGLKLKEFLDSIEEAESLGPILDPTLYRAAADKMHRIRRLAIALMVFQTAVFGDSKVPPRN